MNPLMIERFHMISDYIGIVGLLTQLVMVSLQVRLYRSTGHRSAVLLAASTLLGIFFMVLTFSPRLLGLSMETRLSLDIAAATVETIQTIIGVAGVVLLFRAFESALARARSS